MKMETKLKPIYRLRELLLEKLNPHFYVANAKYIRLTSLAAQDYVLSGNFSEYNHTKMGRAFKNLPGYVAVHKKYNIPYDPYLPMSPVGGINAGLVMDLAWSFDMDCKNLIIDANGNILDTGELPRSEVLHVYHNSGVSAVPVSGLNILMPSELKKIIQIASQNVR